MKKSRYSEEQIVQILREADREPVGEITERHGVNEQSIYGWHKQFGDFNVNDLLQRKEVEAENARLRKLLVDIDLEIKVMRKSTPERLPPHSHFSWA